MATARRLPTVLIDENMPASFGDFYPSRGYRGLSVGTSLPKRSPEASVAAAALAEGAVVVTLDSDFRNLKNAPEGLRGRLQKADRIYFKRCSHPEALSRVMELIDTIEAEYFLAKETNRKFVIQITRKTYTVDR